MAERSEPAAMRWWGWGQPGHPANLPARALAVLRESAGIEASPRAPVALSAVRIDPTRIGEGALSRMRAIVGPEALRCDHEQRVLHAGGKGYPDLVRMREGHPEGAPDAVALPSSHEQVRALLELCERESIAVVPFGGGTSVVGGVAPLAGEHGAVLSLDTALLGAVLELDAESSTVRVQGGMRAPALERHLAAHGLTLGHFPQSYEYVSLGGCAATRSAGQASTGYGAIEKMVLGVRLAAPGCEIDLPPLPATAAGPSLRGLLVGSEGALGVISELALRVRPAPAERSYEGIFFEGFAPGVQALRALALEHALPDVVRLSDESETRVSMALAGSGAAARLGRAYVSARGYGGGCLVIAGFEGTSREVSARRRRAVALLRRSGGLLVGRAPGRAWLRSRFEGPYLRDDLLSNGVMVETLETAAQWSRVDSLHREVAGAIDSALRACATPGIVMCHVSHVYETGASLYFTFIARQSAEDPIAQWQSVKRAAGDAIAAGGGTITHHHAVGRDHLPWMDGEVGEGGLRMLRALKDELDPRGIMNPGKLLGLRG